MLDMRENHIDDDTLFFCNGLMRQRCPMHSWEDCWIGMIRQKILQDAVRINPFHNVCFPNWRGLDIAYSSINFTIIWEVCVAHAPLARMLIL